MQADPVVEDLDLLEDRRAAFVLVRLAAPVDQVLLKGREVRLGDRVVERWALAIEVSIPASLRWLPIPSEMYWADSTGRRNASMREAAMGRPAGWMRELTGRSAMKSPGKLAVASTRGRAVVLA